MQAHNYDSENGQSTHVMADSKNEMLEIFKVNNDLILKSEDLKYFDTALEDTCGSGTITRVMNKASLGETLIAKLTEGIRTFNKPSYHSLFLNISSHLAEHMDETLFDSYGNFQIWFKEALSGMEENDKDKLKDFIKYIYKICFYIICDDERNFHPWVYEFIGQKRMEKAIEKYGIDHVRSQLQNSVLLPIGSSTTELPSDMHAFISMFCLLDSKIKETVQRVSFHAKSLRKNLPDETLVSDDEKWLLSFSHTAINQANKNTNDITSYCEGMLIPLERHLSILDTIYKLRAHSNNLYNTIMGIYKANDLANIDQVFIAKIHPLINSFSMFYDAQTKANEELIVPLQIIDVSIMENRAASLVSELMIKESNEKLEKEACLIQEFMEQARLLTIALNDIKVAGYQNRDTPDIESASNAVYREGFALAQEILNESDTTKKMHEVKALCNALATCKKAIYEKDVASIKALEKYTYEMSGKSSKWNKFIGAMCLLGAAVAITAGIIFAVPTFGISLMAGILGGAGLFCLAKSKQKGLSKKADSLACELTKFRKLHPLNPAPMVNDHKNVTADYKHSKKTA